MSTKDTSAATAATAVPSDENPIWIEKPYTFLFPVKVEAGEEGQEVEDIKSLVLREPDSEALERVEKYALTQAKGSQVGISRALIEACAGLPEGSLKKAHFRDLKALSELIAPLAEGAIEVLSGE